MAVRAFLNEVLGKVHFTLASVGVLKFVSLLVD